MFSKKIISYFSFTKKERIGICAMMALIIFVYILPVFLPARDPGEYRQSIQLLEKELAKKEGRSGFDSSEEDAPVQRGEIKYRDHPEGKKIRLRSGVETPKTNFDPNSASREQWKSFGFSDRLIQTIQHYLDRGGKFKNPEDVKKIYGLGEDQYRDLLPYMRIKKANGEADPNPGRSHGIARPEQSVGSSVKDSSGMGKRYTDSRKSVYSAIDINEADSNAFISLPGIGPALAGRIIRFREKLGGFYSVDQVRETFGLPDSVFIRIRPLLNLHADSIRRIDINEADLATLKQHPYIRWSLANAIVQYRRQHGPFRKPEDLQQLELLTATDFQKIAPYLKMPAPDH